MKLTVKIFWGRVSDKLEDSFLWTFPYFPWCLSEWSEGSTPVDTFLGGNFPRVVFLEAVFLGTILLRVVFPGEGSNFTVFMIKWFVVSRCLCRKVDQNYNITKHTLVRQHKYIRSVHRFSEKACFGIFCRIYRKPLVLTSTCKIFLLVL